MLGLVAVVSSVPLPWLLRYHPQHQQQQGCTVSPCRRRPAAVDAGEGAWAAGGSGFSKTNSGQSPGAPLDLLGLALGGGAWLFASPGGAVALRTLDASRLRESASLVWDHLQIIAGPVSQESKSRSL